MLARNRRKERLSPVFLANAKVKEARDSGINLKTIRLRRNMESFEKISGSLNKRPYFKMQFDQHSVVSDSSKKTRMLVSSPTLPGCPFDTAFSMKVYNVESPIASDVPKGCSSVCLESFSYGSKTGT